MIKILANDGIHESGKKRLEDAGYTVDTQHYDADALPGKLPSYDVIVVRSATKVRESLIAQCPQLKIIARAGVGMDNIDVDYARAQHIEVINTPTASSRAVAELVFAHMLALSRRVYLANQEMPLQGHEQFKQLKKAYSKNSIELSGKTLGIIGFGRIGQETARIALALGMRVLPVDPFVQQADVELHIFDHAASQLKVDVKTVGMDEMLQQADFVTLHIPFTGSAVIGEAEFQKMKPTAYLINCARGGTVDDAALLRALDANQLAGAGLDVYEEEPNPSHALLQHSKVSVSPHIGGSTVEAQEKIGLELADQIIAFLGDDQ